MHFLVMMTVIGTWLMSSGVIAAINAGNAAIQNITKA
jgi:hypothetical protein